MFNFKYGYESCVTYSRRENKLFKTNFSGKHDDLLLVVVYFMTLSVGHRVSEIRRCAPTL
jgi:hypothetical protein